MKDSWLTLMDYSNKHKVSISTLRRRIKSEEINYQLSDGKYFILDEALPTQGAASGSEKAIAPPTRAIASSQSQEPSVPKGGHQNQNGHLVCETSEKLLQEVKRAYSMVLQEKEEQILQLRDEVSDLKTLVRVLENEVARLQGVKTPAVIRDKVPTLMSSDFDLGLDLETF